MKSLVNKIKAKVHTLLISFLLVLIVVLFSSLIIKKDNGKVTVIGNEIAHDSNYDQTFTSSFMTSSFLLKMLNNDASKSIDGKIIKLSYLIKDSDVVIVNIGGYEINNLIKLNENELIYDIEILTRQQELLLSNIKEIKEKIKYYNKYSEVLVCEISCKYEKVDKTLAFMYKDINDQIKEI